MITHERGESPLISAKDGNLGGIFRLMCRQHELRIEPIEDNKVESLTKGDSVRVLRVQGQFCYVRSITHDVEGWIDLTGKDGKCILGPQKCKDKSSRGRKRFKKMISAAQCNDVQLMRGLLQPKRTWKGLWQKTRPSTIINRVDDRQRTLLLHACECGSWDIIDLLINDAGVDFTKKDDMDRTALHFLCMNIGTKCKDLKARISAIKKLVLLGFMIDSLDKNKKTPMDYAVASGINEIILALKLLQTTCTPGGEWLPRSLGSDQKRVDLAHLYQSRRSSSTLLTIRSSSHQTVEAYATLHSDDDETAQGETPQKGTLKKEKTPERLTSNESDFKNEESEDHLKNVMND